MTARGETRVIVHYLCSITIPEGERCQCSLRCGEFAAHVVVTIILGYGLRTSPLCRRHARETISAIETKHRLFSFTLHGHDRDFPTHEGHHRPEHQNVYFPVRGAKGVLP